MKSIGWMSVIGLLGYGVWYCVHNYKIVYAPNTEVVETAPQSNRVVPLAAIEAPRVPDLPDLPVTVTRRPSSVGQGFVGLVQNNGDSFLRLTVTYKDVTTGKKTISNVEVGQKATIELGWLEKCPLASGDSLTLSHPHFKPMTWEF